MQSRARPSLPKQRPTRDHFFWIREQGYVVATDVDVTVMRGGRSARKGRGPPWVTQYSI
jgi:hypothetical protein